MLGPGCATPRWQSRWLHTLFARVRGPVISERHRDYIQAVRVIGASHVAIIYRHILPNVVSPIIIQVSAALSAAILIEAALSYVGLGTQPPAPSWGTMLSEGRTFLETAPWMSIFGLAIALCWLLRSATARDAFDPTLSRPSGRECHG
jgi:peptide/nickel transport system permease protein